MTNTHTATATITCCKNCRDGIIQTEAAATWLHLATADARCQVVDTFTDSVATPWGPR